MSKQKTAQKKYNIETAGPYLTAFFLPILVMIIVFIERGIAPFGDQCFLRTDLYHQYAPFFQELKFKMQHGGSLFYDWNIGGGTAFLPIFAYYLASPLNVFLFLCPASLIIEFITYMIVIKLGLASLSLTIYLNKSHGKSAIAGYPAAFFGIFYALSGYMAAYSWNIMWLDCIWLFPLVILGLEKLVRENKGLLYGVSLGLTILSNYYIAVMVCFGVAIYCFLFLGTEKAMRKDFGSKLVKFILYTLLAVALSAVLLIPYIRYFSMTASASGTFSWKDSLYAYFSLFDMVSRHLMNVEVHTGLEHWPNIYCGVAVFILLPFYYLSKRISLREKIGYTIVLLFFYFSFAARFMDYIWHVFHIPNSLPCRQAFIYIFVLLVMCYRGLSQVEDLSYRDLTFSMLIGLIFVFAAEKLETDTVTYGFSVFYLSALFIVLYTLLIYAHKRGRVYKDLLIVLSFTLICVETCIDTSNTSVTTVTRSDYTDYDDGVDEIMEHIASTEEDLFYRVEKTKLRTKNDGAWLGLRSISTFSSTANANLTAFYKTLGLESSTNAYGSTGSTFFTDMLMDVKYAVSMGTVYESENTRTLSRQSGNVNFYKNKYVLPLAYVLDTEALSGWLNDTTTPLAYQNKLAYEVSGVQNLFLDVTPEFVPSTVVSLTVPASGYYYAYSDVSGPKKLSVSHTDYNRSFTDLNRGYTMDLGWCEEGDLITFTNTEEGGVQSVNVTLYLYQQDLMPQVYEAFAESPMTVTSFSDTHIEGVVDVKNAGTLFTTIPYEAGWTVELDGKPVAYDMEKAAYISVEVPDGKHTLSFSYMTPLFLPSACISLAAAVLMVLIALVEKKRIRLPKRQIFIGSKSEDPEDEEVPELNLLQDNGSQDPEDMIPEPEKRSFEENQNEIHEDPNLPKSAVGTYTVRKKNTADKAASAPETTAVLSDDLIEDILPEEPLIDEKEGGMVLSMDDIFAK